MLFSRQHCLSQCLTPDTDWPDEGAKIKGKNFKPELLHLFMRIDYKLVIQDLHLLVFVSLWLP